MSNELQTMTPPRTEVVPTRGGAMTAYTPDQVALLKRTICKGATDDELTLFVGVCNRTGLDPFTKQIHAIKRWDSREKREVMAVQIGIDGFRLVAERTKEMDGQEGPWWCGSDGVWKELWLQPGPPFAARVVVHRRGHAKPYVGVVKYSQCVQLTKEGKPNVFWARMPDHMLAKCAEAQALRKAFPQELGGIYATEEGDSPEGDADGEARQKPQGLLLGMEQDDSLITLSHWNHLKAALVASGASQGELLAYAGVERPGQIPRERFDELLKLARTPKAQWPRPKPPAPGPAPELPKNGGPPAEPPKGFTPPPVTMQQLEELRAQISRLGLEELEVFSSLQKLGCSTLEDLDEEQAEWILQDMREQDGAREPGQEG